VAACGLAYYWGGELWLKEAAIGSAIGWILSPDLDQEGRTFTERLLRKIPGVGFVFQALWYPYAMLTKHRGLSHAIAMGTILTPVTTWFGTLTRIAWSVLLSLGVVVVLTFIRALAGESWLGMPAWWYELWRYLTLPAVLLAWAWQDFVHVALDYITDTK
jgi:uncharacterized metal-binding protein